MESGVLEFPYRPDPEELCRKLSAGGEFQAEFLELFEECVHAADPAAAFSLQDVRLEDGEVFVGKERFQSLVMARNFSEAEVRRAFIYAVSCGRGLYEIAIKQEDPLRRWWADAIAEDAMKTADRGLRESLRERYRLGRTARMNPGSFPDFPITCQAGIFRLLEQEAARIGLSLTASYLMIPPKSVSGILYETRKEFENCMLCPIEGCPSRKAEYDRKMEQEYGTGMQNRNTEGE